MSLRFGEVSALPDLAATFGICRWAAAVEERQGPRPPTPPRETRRTLVANRNQGEDGPLVWVVEWLREGRL